MRKVGIIGKCSNSRSDGPLDLWDWEIWGLAWDPLPRCDRMFEMHEAWRNFLGNAVDAEAHLNWMAGQKCPIVMLQKEHDIPTSVAFPMEEVAEKIGKTGYGTAYIESSIAYMMAQAIMELQPGDRIGIWGCDLATTNEYAYQRPNMEYLIGFARGKGINVYVPPQNALLSPLRPVPYGLNNVDGSKPAFTSKVS